MKHNKGFIEPVSLIIGAIPLLGMIFVLPNGTKLEPPTETTQEDEIDAFLNSF